MVVYSHLNRLQSAHLWILDFLRFKMVMIVSFGLIDEGLCWNWVDFGGHLSKRIVCFLALHRLFEPCKPHQLGAVILLATQTWLFISWAIQQWLLSLFNYTRRTCCSFIFLVQLIGKIEKLNVTGFGACDDDSSIIVVAFTSCWSGVLKSIMLLLADVHFCLSYNLF